jgi:tetratricopeptide (TPR) repeat protein
MARSRRSRSPSPAARPAPAAPTEGSFLAPAAAIAVVALGIRLLHVWQIHRAPFFTVLMGDSRGYDEWARQIAGGDWIGHDVFYQAPLYPYFLGVLYSLIGRSLLAVRLVQACIGAASCVLLGLAARRLFAARVGLVAGLALAVYAPAIFFDALIQKSVLDVFFICVSLWLVAAVVAGRSRPRTWLALGLAMGGLSLTRENALVFIAVIIGWALVRAVPWRDRMRTAALFVAGLAIVLLPVAVRNQVVGGQFFITTSQFGPNFYIGNNARADGTYASLREGHGSPEYERQDATDLAQAALGRALTPAEVSGYWTDQAMAFIDAHPGAWLKLMARKVALLWNADEMLDTESQATHAEWSLPLRLTGYVGHFGVLVPLAVFGVIATWGERRRLAVVYALLLAYAASVALFYVFARYRFPLVPFLVLFAAAGGVSAAAFVRRASGRRRAEVLAAIAATVVFVNWPMLSTATMQAVTENNLGAALQEDGRLQDAIAHYQRATAYERDYSPAFNNMCTALRATGRVDDAIAAFKRAIAITPGYGDAHYNLANALMAQGRTDEAVKEFRAAAQAQPGSADVHNNFGIALSESGHPEEAVAEFQAALRLDPDSSVARSNLGKLLAAHGSPEAALEQLRRAVELAPDDPAARYDLASTLLEQGRLKEAEAEFREALRLSPRSVAAMNNLGITLGSEGRFDEAIAQFRHALEVQPDFEDAKVNLARALDAERQLRR